MKAGLIVSDHAVLRYLERVGGFDIDRLKREIPARLQPAASAGARGVVIDGHSYLIEQGPEGPILVTVLPRGKYRRHLMRRDKT